MKAGRGAFRAMRRLVAPLSVAFASIVLLAGCSEPVKLVDCGEGLQDVVLYLTPDFGLSPDAPATGAAALPGAEQAFVMDAPMPFLSDPVDPGLRIEGDVVLELWVETQAAVAPIVLGGDPGEGYHLFDQFGSERALIPGYATEYGPVASEPGAVVHYTEILATAPGGFAVETESQVRVLLTSLVTAAPGQPGHLLHTGGDTPSQVRFQAACFEAREWTALATDSADVSLPGNQGLLTGLVPETEGLNMDIFWFDLDPAVERLTVELRQGLDGNPVKDDVDMVILDADGVAVYAAGSPAADETAILWERNLRELLPGDRFGVQVNSYSGLAYSGTLHITQDAA